MFNGMHYHYLVSSENSAFLRQFSKCVIVSGDIYEQECIGNNTGASLLKRIVLCKDLEQISNVIASQYGDFVTVLVDDNEDMFIFASKLGLPRIYYYQDLTYFIVSEDIELITNIIDILCLDLSIDRNYIAHFLTSIPFDNFSNSPLATAYKEIKYLPAGSYLRMDKIEEVKRYWSYWNQPMLPKRDINGLIYDTFLQAVSVRSRANTGVKLSGGLDSSSVACALARVKNERVKCYTHTFEKLLIQDEKIYNDLVVEHIHGKARYMLSDDHWAFKSVPDQFRHPFSEPYQAWFYAQEKLTAETCKQDDVEVLLDGIGGDELFDPSFNGGRYKLVEEPQIKRKKLFRFNQKRTYDIKKIHSSADFIPPFIEKTFYNETNLENKFDQILINLIGLSVDTDTFHRLFSFNYLNNMLDDCIWLNREIYLPRNINRKHPFLDHKLVEAVFRVPREYLTVPSITKYLLREVFKTILPAAIYKRKLKNDFTRSIHLGYEKEFEKIQRCMKDPIICQLGFISKSDFLVALANVRYSNVTALMNPFYRNWVWQAITLEFWVQDQISVGRLRI